VRCLFNRGILEINAHGFKNLFERSLNLLDLLALLERKAGLDEKRILNALWSEIISDHLAKGRLRLILNSGDNRGLSRASARLNTVVSFKFNGRHELFILSFDENVL
jgi:hypothetical protein